MTEAVIKDADNQELDIVVQAKQRIEKKKKRRSRVFSPLLWLTVILPTLMAVGYFGFVASDQYVSESSFVVRTPAHANSGAGGLGALFQGLGGMSRAQDDTYTVQEYIRSRTALDALIAEKIPVRSYYENKGDVLSRFNGLGLEDSHEAFYQYYRDKVVVRFDAVSGLSLIHI